MHIGGEINCQNSEKIETTTNYNCCSPSESRTNSLLKISIFTLLIGAVSGGIAIASKQKLSSSGPGPRSISNL